MRFLLIFWCLMAFAFTPSPASAQASGNWLVGTWTCKTSSRGLRYTYVWRYRSNDTFSMDYSFRGRFKGMRIVANGFGSGQWSAVGDGKIRRHFTSFLIENMTADGRRVAPRGLAGPTQTMTEGPSVLKVTQRSRNAYTVAGTKDSSPMRCRRS